MRRNKWAGGVGSSARAWSSTCIVCSSSTTSPLVNRRPPSKLSEKRSEADPARPTRVRKWQGMPWTHPPPAKQPLPPQDVSTLSENRSLGHASEPKALTGQCSRTMVAGGTKFGEVQCLNKVDSSHQLHGVPWSQNRKSARQSCQSCAAVTINDAGLK